MTGQEPNDRDDADRPQDAPDAAASPTDGPTDASAEPPTDPASAPAEDRGDAATDGDAGPVHRTWLDRLLGRPGKPRKARKQRPHPYAHEEPAPEEAKMDPRRITALWFFGSLAMVLVGYWLQLNYGYISNESHLHPDWELWNGIPLFAGIALLGLGISKRVPYRHHLALAGWILFAAYWAMTARDLFIREENDYANMTGAMLAVFFLNYLSYHEWLNIKRGVTNFATRYMAIVAAVAAGFYFLIAKVTPFRLWLINAVGGHTRWMLDRFGFGSKLGLQFHVDEFDIFGPVLFHYPDTYCDPYRSDPIGAWCAENPDAWQNSTHFKTSAPGTPYPHTTAVPDVGDSWWDQLLFYAPDGDLSVIPVSIILACTAIQTIMLFVGLFMGTKAPLKQRLAWSFGIGALIYVLNLMRNTLVIWAYGRAHMSFFMVHNVLAKVLTLGALVVIALAVFKRFPAFLDALGAVLDLPHRDGPIEKALKIGRRRPKDPVAVPA